ncbi:MAG: DUF5706 domain-containing protein [Neisseria zoodegmatis]|uniref:Pycsar system effector family protein n=1 Tax=Neisseria zoodegmatis TaxID=326523 RepID=UPI0026E93079|nr:Pycsar system effector family protein [Neisseria zoodegmatis]MDO5069632.1 DUF5706 domain-containing protein [Neisseria zoodegmatis]
MTEQENNKTHAEKSAQNDDLMNAENTHEQHNTMSNLAAQEPVLMLENLEDKENLQSPTEEAALNESESADDTAAAAKKAKKKLLKQQRKAKKETAPEQAEEPTLQLGTAKGVETMFRNAFRTEMELLALAATKANIMISLNGFIVSALMISGAFIFSTSPDFLVPAGIFMATAAASIVFALLSASPERMGKMRATVEWLKDVFKRKASLRDFKTRVYEPEAHFVDKSPNILIYEDRVKISKDRYWEMMQDIMANREEVYKKMSEELYWLGSLANKQFKYLNMSYAVFRWGLLFSVLAFIAIKTLPNVVPSMRADKAEAELRNLGINSFKGLYEPSAVQQLPDGRLLVIEDEHSRAASIVSFNKDGTLDENESIDTRIVRGFKRKLSDLEGLTLDNDGYVYAITSHSRNREGVRRPDREHFIRFKIRGNEVVELSSFNGLVDILETSEQVEQLIRGKIGTMLDFKTINIEGLAYDPTKNRLLLGFRDPEFSDKSMILYIDNPKEMFEKKAKPNFVDVAFLDIKGGGIRSINYDAVLKSFILTNEVKDEKGKKFPQFWLWNGEPASEAKPIDLPNMNHMTNVEAVDSVKVNGQNRLIFMSDDGDATKNIGGKYMIVEYDKF